MPEEDTDGGPKFAYDTPCDWAGGGEKCGATPTAWVGDIYYACEDHYEDYLAEAEADGGA
jgi:hypothetical protein